MQEQEMIELVKKVQAKEEQAFVDLYEQYCNLVFSQAYKATRSYSEAQDITQEVFLQVFKSIETLREPKLFPIWLYRITSSKCVKVYREHRPSFIEGEVIEEMSVQDSHKDFNPRESVRFHHDQEMMSFFISSLKENVQQVIKAMYLEQKSLKEISEQFHIPLGTAKYLAFQGRKELKAMIQNYESNNHVKLDFHTSSPVLFTFPIVSFACTWVKEHKSIIQKSMQLAFTATAVIVVVQGVSTILPEIQAPGPNEEISQPSTIPQDSYASFPTIIVNDQKYSSASQAYAALLEFSSKDELNTRPKDVCVAYEPLVNAMKEYGGQYYQNLKQSGWIDIYEQIIKHA